MLLLWFCFDRELEIEWLIFLSIYDDFLGFFNLLYFFRQCWKCWTKSGAAGEDKPPDREWLCFEMVGDFSIFSQINLNTSCDLPTYVANLTIAKRIIYIIHVRKFLSLICL